MIIPFTLFLGTLGYLFYMSKEELTIVERENIDLKNKKDEEDDLYKELEDLFI